MFFLIAKSTQTTDLFLGATRGHELIVTTLDDVVDDIVYGQYLPAHCITCIEVQGGTRLSSTFLKKLARHSRVIVYSDTYKADFFIYYWEMGITYIAGDVSPTELSKLFLIPVSEEIKEKQHNLEINTTNGYVKFGDKSILLTVAEVKLFSSLVAAGGSYLTRPQLLDAIGQNIEHDERLIDSHLKRIRQKLKKYGLSPNIIVTGYGFGYRIDFTKIDETAETTDLKLVREQHGP